MELSFRTKVILDLTMIFLAPLSSVVAYPLGLILGILIALIAFVALVDTIRNHYIDRNDFQKKIIHEALDILNLLVSDTNCRHIDYNIWSGKNDGFKVEMLGHQDYGLWNAFYESVEEWNEHFRSVRGVGKWEDFVKFNDQCAKSFLKVYDGISWVKESEEAKARITDFLSRAERSAGFSRNLRSV